LPGNNPCLDGRQYGLGWVDLIVRPRC